MAMVKSSKYLVVGVYDKKAVYSGVRLASRFGSDGNLAFIFGVDVLPESESRMFISSNGKRILRSLRTGGGIDGRQGSLEYIIIVASNLASATEA